MADTDISGEGYASAYKDDALDSFRELMENLYCLDADVPEVIFTLLDKLSRMKDKNTRAEVFERYKLSCVIAGQLLEMSNNDNKHSTYYDQLEMLDLRIKTFKFLLTQNTFK